MHKVLRHAIQRFLSKTVPRPFDDERLSFVVSDERERETRQQETKKKEPRKTHNGRQMDGMVLMNNSTVFVRHGQLQRRVESTLIGCHINKLAFARPTDGVFVRPRCPFPARKEEPDAVISHLSTRQKDKVDLHSLLPVSKKKQ
jgi:hypothetical protein